MPYGEFQRSLSVLPSSVRAQALRKDFRDDTNPSGFGCEVLRGTFLIFGYLEPFSIFERSDIEPSNFPDR